MAVSYRQNFDTLCRAIRAGNAAMLEYRNVDSGVLMYLVCAVNKLPDGQAEYVPIARMFDHIIETLILPGPNGPNIRPELN